MFKSMLDNLFNKKSYSLSMLMGVAGNQYDISKRGIAFSGYIQNVIGYRCIKEIALATSAIMPEIEENGIIKDPHPILEILRKPNPTQSYKKFIAQSMSEYKLYGNLFIEKVTGSKGKTAELWIHSVQNVVIDANTDGYFPSSYTVTLGNGWQKTFYYNKQNGKIESPAGTELLHYYDYHPSRQFEGLSPLETCIGSIITHNEGTRWNSNLLKNSSVPSGVFSTQTNLTEETYERLKKNIKEEWSGASNAGKNLLLEAGLSFNQASISPKDMDFINSLLTAARNIASAIGIPFALVIPEASTYNNLKTAREMFLENTVIPETRMLLEAISAFIGFPDATIRINEESIIGLENKRQTKIKNVLDIYKAGLISAETAAIELGYEYEEDKILSESINRVNNIINNGQNSENADEQQDRTTSESNL